jgi:hypothetical protein
MYTFQSILPPKNPEETWLKIYYGQDPNQDPDPVKIRPGPQHWPSETLMYIFANLKRKKKNYFTLMHTDFSCVQSITVCRM